MKVKLKDKNKKMNRWNSFGGLNTKIWEKLNVGETVEIDIIPKPALAYLETVKKKEK